MKIKLISLCYVTSVQVQCFVFAIFSFRSCKCGAWSFDDFEGICYLHTVDSCCGQLGKRKEDANFISGYNCHKYSSSIGECPGTLRDRVGGCTSEYGDPATTPQYLTPTVSIISAVLF